MRFISLTEIDDLNRKQTILSTIQNLTCYYPQGTLLELNHEWFTSPAVFLYYPSYPAPGEIARLIANGLLWRLTRDLKQEDIQQLKMDTPPMEQEAFMESLRHMLTARPKEDIAFLNIDVTKFSWPWLSRADLQAIAARLDSFRIQFHEPIRVTP